VIYLLIINTIPYTITGGGPARPKASGSAMNNRPLSRGGGGGGERSMVMVMSVWWWLMMLASGVRGIPIPMPIITPIPQFQAVVPGQNITLVANLNNANFLGYSPFLELLVPASCYTFLGATPAYETAIPKTMASPTITTFNNDTILCANDPFLSTILPDVGNCSRARIICALVNQVFLTLPAHIYLSFLPLLYS